MKWTTANVKSPNYGGNHDIYVGTHTGSFKKLVPSHEEDPFFQQNLQNVSSLGKDSRITALSFTKDMSEILIGRAKRTVQIHSVKSEKVERTIEFERAPVVGLGQFDNQVVAGFADGQIQCIVLDENTSNAGDGLVVSAGDDIAHLRQCSEQRNLIATGGKGRQNNLKVFDIAAEGKQVFSSKNLPNDYLQLEVPIWDSDVGFIDTPYVLATCSRYGYVRVYDTRKQRRPVQSYATENQMSFTSLAASGNYIYAGTTMGAMKAFDVRRMKTFVHTYKGFTGGISDLYLDTSGKFLASACLDRYVRVHDADSCLLLYQCYVKSKVTRVLMRESMEQPNRNSKERQGVDRDICESANAKDESKLSDDEEYNEIFERMQTICENNDDVEEETSGESHGKNMGEVIAGSKRKRTTGEDCHKKKRN